MATALSALARVLPEGVELVGADVVVDDVVHDSRAAGPRSLFAAVPGSRTDGHDHAPAAVAAGAAAVLVERRLDVAVPQLRVPDVRRALGTVAAEVHGRPSDRIRVVGVTGTNGKTTTTWLVEAAAAAAGLGTGVIGTTGARIHGAGVPNVRTTPEATDLQRLLRRFVDRGVAVAAVEVSSHGLALHRVDGTRCRVAGFTHLGQDHLDFHGTREAYLAAKQRLFTPPLSEYGVVVVDDAAGRLVAAQAEVPVTTLATTGGDADAVLSDVVIDLGGCRAVLHRPDGTSTSVATRLLGAHNLANAALAQLLAEAVGIDPVAAAAGIAACPGVPGRLEPVAGVVGSGRAGGSGAPAVLVDYAHTPDALVTVLDAVRGLVGAVGRVVVVVGAGGDRDPTKRAPMGAAATRADVAVLSTDNPRSEDPAAILASVARGARDAVAAGARCEVLVEPDRAAAIACALGLADAGDVVVIAGKGHETGQELAGRTVPFDDRVVAARVLAGDGQ